MAKLSTTRAKAAQSVLVYGPPKAGKTELVGKLAHKHKLIWFDLESGSATLYKLPPEAQDNIELISLPDSRSYPIAIETCLKVIKGHPLTIDETTGKVLAPNAKRDPERTYLDLCLSDLGPEYIVVFDSLTQLTNSAIAHITKGQPDDYKLQTDDWGNLGKLMDIFLSHIQTAKYNVVCISHEVEAELPDGRQKLVPVAGTRNFSRNSAKYFGHVVYVNVVNRKHVATSSTTALNNIVTGSRLDVATEKMTEPSLLPIFAGSSSPSPSPAQSQPSSQPTPAPQAQPSQPPGQIAASQLQAKLAAMRAGSK